MPKQSTAAQAARNAARGGMKYTEALRARKASLNTSSPGVHVVQFLAGRSGSLHQPVGGIAAAWAHDGRRVLLLEESDDRWMWTTPGRGRDHQQKPSAGDVPEPQTTTLWASPAGPGALVHHTCLWEPREPAKKDRGPGLPRRDRSLLTSAVKDLRDDYDVIVLLPRRGWSHPDTETATAYVALAEVDDFPHTDCRVIMPSTREEQGVPLSPEQSAAVLRDRCLSFLFGGPRGPIPLEGVIWRMNWNLPVDAAYLAGIDRDMERVGLPTLGWTLAGYPSHRELPDPHQLRDPDYVRRYRTAATRLRTVLDRRPARQAAPGQPTAP